MKFKRINTLLRIYFKQKVVIGIFFLITIELTLRLGWGFCDTVLFREDPHFEYIQTPQNRKRFGNKIYYNIYSQRSYEIKRNDVVLTFFGDSVINGGVLIDQDSLATTKLSNYLTIQSKRSVRVLNIAAGSWGPDNCFAYLREFGDFQTKMIVLVVSSHDAYDNIDFKKVVGINPQYPRKQYVSAIVELFGRYLLPRLTFRDLTSKSSMINKKSDTSFFNSGFEDFYSFTKKKNIPFLVYLHAQKAEWQTQKYNEQGQKIIDFCQQRHIALIKELDYRLPSSIYLDEIHVNHIGQQAIFDIFKLKLNMNLFINK